MQNLVREVLLAPPLSLYIARLIEAATPSNPNSPVPEVAHYLRYGPSPRGAQAAHLRGQGQRPAQRAGARQFLRISPTLRCRPCGIAAC